MKAKTGCIQCRRRHRKCVVRPGASTCNACQDSIRDCQFEPRYQFRQSRKKASARRHKPASPEEGGNRQGNDHSDNMTHAILSNEHESNLPVPTPDNTAPAQLSSSDEVFAAATHLSNRQIGDEELPHEDLLLSSGLPSFSDQGSRLVGVDSNKLSPREMQLIRIYVSELGPLADACDDHRHFTLQVPRLALSKPIIMYGILALASLYDSLTDRRQPNMESTHYHNQCIERLIEELAKPEETYNSTLLTAVVLLRLYEENDWDNDIEHYHLSGTQKLLHPDAAIRFAAEGGLAEAACWIHLRQAIYIALVKEEAIQIPLDTFRAFTAFCHDDETSYCNRAVHLCATLIQQFHRPMRCEGRCADDPGGTGIGSQPSNGDQHRKLGWDKLEEQLDQWYHFKPVGFTPLRREEADLLNGRPFTSLYMISAIPVVAMQHYYAGKILCCLQRCRNPDFGSDYQAARHRASNERLTVYCLGVAINLALANPEATNAFYLPAHLLHLCGYLITHPLQRSYSIEYLKKVKKKIRWDTELLTQSLQKQWEELDDIRRRDFP